MADRRHLLLDIDVDADGRPLRQLGDAADAAADDLEEFDRGLKKLDDSTTEVTARLGDLRKEFGRSGDLAILKDIRRADTELKRLARDRKLLVSDKDADGIGLQLGAQIGASTTTGIFAAVSAGLKNIPPQAKVAAAGFAAGIAPGIGAIVAAGIIGAAGVGGVVGGLILSAKDQRVEQALAGLKGSISRQLTESAAPFVPAVQEAVLQARSEFRDLDDELRRIFAGSARYLEPLTAGIGAGAEGFLGGFADAAEQAGPVIRELSDGIARLGHTVGGVFRDLADDAPAAAQALGTLFDVLTIGLAGTGKVVEGLTNAYEVIDKTAALVTGNRDRLVEYAYAESVAAAEAGALESATYDMAIQMADAAEVTERQRISLDELTEATRRAHDISISAAEAQLDLAEARQAAKDAADGHKKVSADEERALLRLATQTNNTTGALERAGATAAELSKHSNGTRESFIRLARQMGFSADEAKRLADRYLAIPKNVNTRLSNNAGAVTGAVRTYNAWLDSIPREVRTRLVTEQQTVRGGFREFSEGGPVIGSRKGVDTVPAMLAGGEYVLNSRTVDALGGQSAVDRMVKAVVAGGKASIPSAAPRSSGGGGIVIHNLTVMANDPNEMLRQLRDLVWRHGGGNAQTALGR